MPKIFLLLSIALQLPGQTTTAASDTLEALLVEVRQLRQNIEAMTVASQRVQIALYSLQSQDAAVVRSVQRLDRARSICAEKEEHRQHTAAELQRIEGGIAGGKLSATEAKPLEARLRELKSGMETLAEEVQTCRAGEADAASQLRTDQAVLAELRDRLERFDKQLQRPGDAVR